MGTVIDEGSEHVHSRMWQRFQDFRHSNKLAVFIVYATLMIDNMLLTAIVPILPEYFFEEKLGSTVETNTSAAPHMATIGSVTGSNATMNLSSTGCTESQKSRTLKSENLYLSFLIASKPLVQLIANLAVGPLTDKFGYDIPMFTGYVVLIASSLIFAYGKSYGVLFFARALQGIGSASASTAGMGMLADRFQDDTERGQMIGIALGGLAMGVLVGPTFASVTYEFAGKTTPFLVLAAAALLIGLLQAATRQLQIRNTVHRELKSSIIKLLTDPYILVAAFALMLGNMGIGVLETGQPIWMMRTMCAEKWMLGVAFLPESFSYMISIIFFGWVSHRIGRWVVCFSSFYVTVIGCLTIPLCKSVYELIGPGFVIGTAVGMVDATIFPIMGYLVDTRHEPLYGSVYAIADAAFCTAFIIGPLLAGTVIKTIGFFWVMTIVAILNFVFAPFFCFLRSALSISEETTAILKETDEEYNTVTYDPQLASLGRSIESDAP